MPHRDIGNSRGARKRALDRVAQRATRQRTKEYIRHLEERLSSLETRDGQSEIARLAHVVDKLRTDNYRLRNALAKLRATIEQVLPPTVDQSKS